MSLQKITIFWLMFVHVNEHDSINHNYININTFHAKDTSTATDVLEYRKSCCVMHYNSKNNKKLK